MKKVSEGDTFKSVSFHNKFGWCLCCNRGDTDGSTKASGNCGLIRDPNNCFAHRKTCDNCGKRNHFAALCHSGKCQGPHTTQSIKAVDQETGPGDDSDEKYTWLATHASCHAQWRTTRDTTAFIWELPVFSARHWCTVQHHSSTAVRESCEWFRTERG